MNAPIPSLVSIRKNLRLYAKLQLVQIRAADRTGLLARQTAVFERDGVDNAWAKVTTLGAAVVDVFGIVVPALTGGTADPAAVRGELEHDLYAVLPTPPPAEPVERAG